MSRSFTATIKENLPVHATHNLLTVSVPESVPAARPGQFFMVGVNRGTDPLLKRAFSLFRRTDGCLQILYRIRGKGTGILRNMKEGTVLDMLGPLGNFYPMPSENSIPLVIAGGIGIASVFSLAEEIAGRARVFYGARTKEDLLMLNEVKVFAKELTISTDDGSMGRKGTAADALRTFLASQASLSAQFCIYSCGPYPLLKAIGAISREYRIRSYVSMEEHMACGIGACLGCVVKTYDGYKSVCKEGPVMNAAEIVW
ncbi:MAG TPA: dihydroorotate dehydrogenase electron transfer subunit [Thermodesulfovibrionales bacterium]|nr:dihydroorotate dehydrogenase electron transfer subunit [Thermodesulfovibrionales bacterium]